MLCGYRRRIARNTPTCSRSSDKPKNHAYENSAVLSLGQRCFRFSGILTIYSLIFLPKTAPNALLTEEYARNGGITMQSDHKRSPEKSTHNSMAITVEGHQVALYFAREPDIQVALKIKQALLGTFLTAGK